MSISHSEIDPINFTLPCRLFYASVVHNDSDHLLSNLALAIPACLHREAQLGSSLLLVVELVTLTALSHGLFVAWAVIQKQSDDPDLYIRSGGVGLSAVALAIQARVPETP